MKLTVVAGALASGLCAVLPALAEEPAPAPPALSDPPLPQPLPAPLAAYEPPGVASPPPTPAFSPAPPPPPLPAAAPAGVRDSPEASATPRSFALDLGVATEFPIAVGGYVGAELPGRILLQVGAGVMPSGYTSAVNGILTGVGAYDATVGNFLQNAISNSFVLRLSGGWRPFRDHGFEMLAGYTLMTLGGSAAEGDIINAVLTEAHASQRVPSGSGASIPLSATMHNVHVTLGWRWLAASDHLVIRASLSYLQCLAANVGVSLPGQGQAMEASVNQALNSLVSPYLTQYVKTPLVGLSAAYRF